MAKKTKRKVSRVSSPAQGRRETPTPESEVHAPSPSGKSSFSRRTTIASPVEFNPDYTYVIKDLKRIGTLAGTFFVILIILSFIIK